MHIIGLTELQLQDKSISPEHAEYLQIVLQSSKHLHGLISTRLDNIKSENTNPKLNKTQFNLYTMLSFIATSSRARKKSLELILEFDRVRLQFFL